MYICKMIHFAKIVIFSDYEDILRRFAGRIIWRLGEFFVSLRSFNL